MVFTLPFTKGLLDSISCSRIIIRTEDINELKSIESYFNKSSIKLEKILLWLNNSDDIYRLKDYKHLPIIVFLDKIDKIKTGFPNEISIFLSSIYNQNYEAIKSLYIKGITCGIYLNKKDKINWDLLIDLYKYYLNHQDDSIKVMEPFSYIDKSFSKRHFNDFNPIFYNNPKELLHLNSNGDIFLSLIELDTDKYIGNIFDKSKDYQKVLDQIYNKYHSYFLNRHACASCIGYTICRCTFSNQIDANKCQKLFHEIVYQKNITIEKSTIANEVSELMNLS